MEMTDKEICQEYREAKNKNQQIRILADLNLCTPREILDILTAAGEISGVNPPKLPKAAAPTRSCRSTMPPETVKELIRLAEEGLSSIEIAERLGLDRQQVTKKRWELRKKGMLFDDAARAELAKTAEPKPQKPKEPIVTPKPEAQPPENDAVNHPRHYTRGGIECIDAIEAATVGLSGIDAYCIGNAIKYLWRFKDKNGTEDLQKAIWYIRRLADKEA